MSNGNEHAANGDARPAEFTRLDKALYEERPMRIVCIGAGASGLLLAYKLQRSFGTFELALYDKNEKVTGTWWENRYPGCACDVPAHTYTWSFEPKTDWSSVYAGADEIFKYFSDFAVKYDLLKYCKLRHQVVGAAWDDKRGGWDVDVVNHATGETVHDRCDILINATGILNAWKWPDIAGLNDYKGILMHTANYDRSVELTGKHVGLIGNGSSGIQVLPAIHPKVSRVTTFVRRPTWVAPVPGLEQRAFTPEEIKNFQEHPESHLAYRRGLEASLNALFPLFLSDSEVQKASRQDMTERMKKALGDKSEALAEKLIPKFAVGCRRITPGAGYLETLAKDNVEVIYGEIERATEKGLLSSNGKEYQLDAIICATGFNTSYRPRFKLVGKNNKVLAEEWKNEAKSYFGMAAADFPNYFMALGPNSPVGNGPLLVALEAQLDYMLKFMDRWQTENIHSFAPKGDAIEDFIAFKDQYMERTVWSEECHSWYKNNSVSGKVTALWPGSTMHYLEIIADVRYDDWDIVHSGKNRFEYFGNGFSRTEMDPTADWGYYIRDHDDGPYLGRRKRWAVMTKSGSRAVNTAANFLG